MSRNVACSSIGVAVYALAGLLLLISSPAPAQDQEVAQVAQNDGAIFPNDPDIANDPQATPAAPDDQNAPPVLAIDQTVLYFHKVIGESNPPSQSLSISNAGGFTYQWSATKTNDWLVLSQASGSSPSTVNVSISLDLETSQHLLDTITIASDQAINAPKSVVVVVSVDHGSLFGWGDADCSGGVDIDDVVYVISYIFAGGAPPGDTDNNGIQDCP